MTPVNTARMLLYLVLLLPFMQAVGADRLDDLLERIRITETRHFDYRETRYLQLMAEPWQASGDMYISPTKMVIAQRAPTVVKTLITADRMLHIDKDRNIHRSLKLARPFAVPAMEPFLQLLYGTGDRASLEQEYMVAAGATAQGWTLQLTPRAQAEHDIARLRLSGASDNGPDHMMLEYADGDRTEWQLTLLTQGAEAAREMQQALAED